MRNREGNGGVQPAGRERADGRLWFPTQDGVVVVDPAHVTAGATRAAARRRAGRRRRRERIRIGARLDRARRPISATSQIEYTALTFLEPTNVRFRYRLEPYDADWVDAGNRRTAFYTKVPPGRYTFRVEASDAAGGVVRAGAELLAVACVRSSGRRGRSGFGGALLLLVVRRRRRRAARGACSARARAARARRRRAHGDAART